MKYLPLRPYEKLACFMIKYRKDTDGIVTLTFDMDNNAVNLMNHTLGMHLLPVLEQLKTEKAEEGLRGVIITSAKNSFMAGGDLQYLYQSVDSSVIFKYAESLQKTLREFELLGVPMVAAINGSALGSGYEFALATHYRIMLQRPESVIGLPEVNYGLMPGSGGISRLLWRLGLQKAAKVLLEGKRHTPMQALSKKLVDALEDNMESMLQHAHRWILENPDAKQAWDKPDGRITGGTLKTWRNAHYVTRITAEVIAETHNNDPARKAILAALVEGTAVDFETANRIAGRYFTWLISNKKSKNMTRAFWFDTNKVRQGKFSPVAIGHYRHHHLGIIGAGRIGSAIARQAACRGIKVLLKDINHDVAVQGKEVAIREIEQLKNDEGLTEMAAEQAIALITTTNELADLSSCDVIIESVFEHEQIKANVVLETEQFIDKKTMLATNTAALSIDKIAEGLQYPDRFLGLHFLPPLQSGSIVEVVRGKQTDADVIGSAFDLVKTLGCLPILVNDFPGFFVLRVWCQYVLEAVLMVTEGQIPSSVERAGLQSGMQQSPLFHADRLGFDTMLTIGSRHQDHQPAIQAIKTMMDEHERSGYQKGGGFYEETKAGPRIWNGLYELFPTGDSVHIQKDVTDRLLYIQIIEMIECVEAGIIHSLQEANLGTLIGGGFSQYHGGAVQFIISEGLEKFKTRAKQLEAYYGPRFKLPESMPVFEQKLAEYEKSL